MKKWLPALLLLLAPVASGQTFVKASAVGATNATTVSSAALSPSASDIIAAACLNDTSGVTASVTDSQGNTFTAFPRYTDAPWSGGWFYAPVKSTAADTVKCTLSGKATFVDIFAVDVRGATAVATVANASGASTDPATTGTTTAANELLVAAVLCSATCGSTTGQNYTMDGYGNAMATLVVAAPSSATITFAPANTKWMQQMIGFTGTPVTTNPPVVSVATPAYSGTITLTASATDSNSTITSVQFLLDGVALGSPVTTAPYTYAWNTAGTTNAGHSIAAVATNAAGQSTTSAALSVEIDNTTTAMTIESPITIPQMTTGTAYSIPLSSLNDLAGGVPPYTYSLASGAVPAGMTLSSAGVLEGTPTTVGTSSFAYTVTDSSGQAVTVTVRVVAEAR